MINILHLPISYRGFIISKLFGKRTKILGKSFCIVDNNRLVKTFKIEVDTVPYKDVLISEIKDYIDLNLVKDDTYNS